MSNASLILPTSMTPTPRYTRVLIGVLLGAGVFNYLRFIYAWSFALSFFLGIVVAYLPSYIDGAHLAVTPREGSRFWPWLAHHRIWTSIFSYFPASIQSEYDFAKHAKEGGQFVFAVHPHGMLSVDHALIFTDCVGFMSKVAPLPRRDLGASVIFLIPGLRELCLWLGVVDAGASTAHKILSQGYSMQLYPGGIQEQIETDSTSPKVVAKGRYGFVKLAMQYDIPIVPVYIFGEDKLYTSITWFHGLRRAIVKYFRVGITLFFGRADALGMLPHKVPLVCCVGEPLWPKNVDEASQKKVVEQRALAIQAHKQSGKAEPTSKADAKKPSHSSVINGTTVEFARGRRLPREVTKEEVNEMHDRYVDAIEKLFNKYKSGQPLYANSTLKVLSARG